MGLISKEQAEIIINKIKEISRLNELGVRYIDMGYVESIIMDCQHLPPVDWPPKQIDYLEARICNLQENINVLDDNYTKLRDGSDNDFSIVHQRIDKLQKNQDRLDHWLHALERSVMELKGIMLGGMAATNPRAEMERYRDLMKGKE